MLLCDFFNCVESYNRVYKSAEVKRGGTFGEHHVTSALVWWFFVSLETVRQICKQGKPLPPPDSLFFHLRKTFTNFILIVVVAKPRKGGGMFLQYEIYNTK